MGRKLGLFFGTLLICLLILEIGLRILRPLYFPGFQETLEYDPQLGFHLRSGIHAFNTTDFQHEVITNEVGTSNFQSNFAGYKHRLFCVGDSFTQGVGVPADSSFPFQLDLFLNRNRDGFYQKDYAIVNLGTGGFGGLQSLLALERFAEKIGPPVVILYLGCDNDYQDDLVFQSDLRKKHLVQGNPHWGWAARPLQWFFYSTQIGLRLNFAWNDYRRAEINAKAAGNRKPPAEVEEIVLQQLIADSKKWQAKLIMSWSDRSASYAWLKSWCVRRQIAFADWGPKVDSVKSNIPRLPLKNQHSTGHYRSWVNRIIAEEFARELQAEAH